MFKLFIEKQNTIFPHVTNYYCRSPASLLPPVCQTVITCLI